MGGQARGVKEGLYGPTALLGAGCLGGRRWVVQEQHRQVGVLQLVLHVVASVDVACYSGNPWRGSQVVQIFCRFGHSC